LKIAGGREKNLRDLQSWIFYVGGTSALIGNYLATAGRPNEEDLQMIEDLELTWADDRVGDVDPTVMAGLNVDTLAHPRINLRLVERVS
jgi:biotin synthase-like enzyme